MARLTRAKQQEITRTKVLDAAKAEFAEHGFRGTAIDRIAHRADLTRGAVYSNFPGKLALYLSVLAREAEFAPAPPAAAPGASPGEAMRLMATTWAERFPRRHDYDRTGVDTLSSPMLSVDFMPEVRASAHLRRPFAQLIELDAILLAASMGNLADGSSFSHYRPIARSALTMLLCGTQLSFVIPDFVDPDLLVEMCRQVVDMKLSPQRPRDAVPGPDPVRTSPDTQWNPRRGIVDLLHSRPAELERDGVVAILGLNRLRAIEELIEGSPDLADIAVVLVCDPVAEVAPLARLALADFSRSLRYAFPESAVPTMRFIVDNDGALTEGLQSSASVADTETALIIRSGNVITRYIGRGSVRAAAESCSRH
ncbi:TetR/AcrR family transcriptional regulator [Nocardia camponoti]|uniref:TetR family transcriptional regulator n=1 Tax=Nocardia camponoti TaxID=1616106 RepID=A0A917QQC1_9NOCA|nr:TetR/AcrR family transcriptional regulator [Nocardia camponoti]GGK63095.1 TetR family transcriptional regulator [Nocardia camponoti]